MATPDFIVELRKHVGHAPLWLIGGTVLCLDGDRVLLEKRADDGRWTAISGIVEPGEHPIACVVREAREEVGVEIEVGRMLWCVASGLKTYLNGDQVRYLDHGYLGRVVGGELRPDGDETMEVAWFPVDDLPTPRHVRLERMLEIALGEPGDVVACW